MDFLPGLTPLEGGFSGETFVAEGTGERTVVRIYGPRSAWRGPRAPEIDAAVLRLVRGLVPVPEVLEVRAGSADVPGLLVTSFLPGVRLDSLLPSLSAAQVASVAAGLGTLSGRLGHLAMPRPGMFTGPDLTIGDFPPGGEDLEEWVDEHASALALPPESLDAVRRMARDAQALLDEEIRVCLVHSDLNPKNLLVDPATLAVTGLLDWEFAHAGSPFADLGNLLRFEDDPVFVEAVLASYAAFMPAVPDDVLDRARAADLLALVELASRAGENPIADRAHARLLELAASA